MTNKEAAEILKLYNQRLDGSCSNLLGRDKEALVLAIKALEDVDELYDDDGGFALGYSVGYVDGLAASEGVDD